MATQTKYFSDLAINAEFNMEVAGLTGAFRKVSAQKAINLATPVAGSFKIRSHQVVTITVPDPVPPTAEEIAAKRLRRVTNAIEDMLDASRRARKDHEEAIERGDWYGQFANSSTIEAQMKAAVFAHIGASAKNILEHAEGGIEELTRRATQNAMRYARFGHHSTSAVSNVAEEMQAAAWAEIAEACGVGRL